MPDLEAEHAFVLKRRAEAGIENALLAETVVLEAAVKVAVEKEREECAKVADAVAETFRQEGSLAGQGTAEAVAELIRRRNALPR